MARTKGSKNKKPAISSEQINICQEEIAELESKLAAKKQELKDLIKQKEEEDRNKLLDIIKNSDKSYEEIMAFFAPAAQACEETPVEEVPSENE